MKAKGLICNFLLLIIFILFSFYCYGKGGGFIYDTFREAIIPEQIIQGKVLYKDILCLYPPLGYYFNTLLFKLFGSSLNILYIAGVINSAIVLLCIYKIMSEISEKRTVFITLLTIMLMFVFVFGNLIAVTGFYLTLSHLYMLYPLQYNIYMSNIMKYKIQSSKGAFYVSDYFYPILNKAKEHAQENIKNKNKSLLFLEEGLWVNYFLDIPLIDAKLYSLHSHTVPTLGEEYIIDKLKNNQPDYIYSFVSPYASTVHGEFGIDYAKKIFEYINNNYELESTLITPY